MTTLKSYFKPFANLMLAASGLFLFLIPAGAEESYSGIKVNAPEGWTAVQAQTFSGSIPSRAWVYRQNESEVLVSAMMTEGVREGLAQADPAALIRIYTSNVVIGWGGYTEDETGTEYAHASFCGGEAGYSVKARFGEKRYSYYGCLKSSLDWGRIATAVTWLEDEADDSEAERRLTGFVSNTVVF